MTLRKSGLAFRKKVLGMTLIKKLKPALYARLFGSFVVNNTSTNTILNFQPPYSTEEGIAIMINWFKNNQSASELADTSIN